MAGVRSHSTMFPPPRKYESSFLEALPYTLKRKEEEAVPPHLPHTQTFIKSHSLPLVCWWAGQMTQISLRNLSS